MRVVMPQDGEVDVLVVGSGLIGATVARVLAERRPDLRLKMLERGAGLSDRIGTNLRNIPFASEEVARVGPGRISMAVTSEGAFESTPADRRGQSRLGRVNLEAVGDSSSEMPAAMTASCVGGMATLWRAVTPRPGRRERVSYIPSGDWETSLAYAEQLLNVQQESLPPLREVDRAVLHAITTEVGSSEAKRLPVAVRLDDGGSVWWTGTDTVLPGIVRSSGRAPQLALSTETLCRRLVLAGDRVEGVVAEHLPTGRLWKERARIVFLACDALRTPQLLWCSGVRPDALGRYLNEHLMTVASIRVRAGDVDRPAVKGDPFLCGLYLPSSGERPFSVQVTCDWSSRADSHRGPQGGWVATVVTYSKKQISRFDRVQMSQDRVDAFGMPCLEISYERRRSDMFPLNAAVEMVHGMSAKLGGYTDGGEPVLLPAGSSLHYLGTTRMGSAVHRSVCDDTGRVWGCDNLFVGGNGVIPVALTCHPTLTSVALAVRSAFAISRRLPRRA